MSDCVFDFQSLSGHFPLAHFIQKLREKTPFRKRLQGKSVPSRSAWFGAFSSGDRRFKKGNLNQQRDFVCIPG
jgi:hypothetical protein